MSNSPGRFVWYELMTTDTASAGAFYGDVVGWSAKDSGVPGMAYTLFSAGETSVAGMMALADTGCGPEARPGWIGYIGVEDVDAAAARLAESGGAVHRAPDDIPGVGRFAMVADPQGAAFVLFRGFMTETPEAAPGTPGHGGWHELATTDPEAAFGFYASQFGWTKDRAVEIGAMGIYQLFAVDEMAIGGIMPKPEALPAPFWLYYFNVDTITAAEERVKAGGGQILNGPMEVPGGLWILQGLDPQGAMFALVGPHG